MITLVKHRTVEIDYDSQNTRPEGVQPSFLHGKNSIFSILLQKVHCLVSSHFIQYKLNREHRKINFKLPAARIK